MKEKDVSIQNGYAAPSHSSGPVPVSSNQSLVELSDPVPSSISQAMTTEQKSEINPDTPVRLVEANTIIRDRYGTMQLVSASAPLSPAIPQLACQ